MKFEFFLNESSDKKLLKLYQLAKDTTEYKPDYEEFIKKEFGGSLSPHIEKALKICKTPESFLKKIKDFEKKNEDTNMKNILNFNQFVNEEFGEPDREHEYHDDEEKFKEVKPELYIVKIDETHFWKDDIQKKAGKIYGVYLLDKSVETHLAELRGSWWLEFLYNVFENYENFDDDELTEMENNNGDEPGMYVHNNSTFEDEHKVVVADSELEEAMESEKDYNDFIEYQVDQIRGNPIWK